LWNVFPNIFPNCEYILSIRNQDPITFFSTSACPLLLFRIRCLPRPPWSDGHLLCGWQCKTGSKAVTLFRGQYAQVSRVIRWNGSIGTIVSHFAWNISPNSTLDNFLLNIHSFPSRSSIVFVCRYLLQVLQ